MKELLRFILVQVPWVYEQLLRWRSSLTPEVSVFMALVGRRDVVLDVGANYGDYTLLFSHLVGRHGKVHSFEPVPSTFSALSQKVSRHGRFKNIALNQAAVGASERETVIYMPGEDAGQASLTAHQIGSWEVSPKVSEFTCQMLTLDGYLKANALERVDFVKIDIEGAELFALEGFSEGLVRTRPVVYLEVCRNWMNDFQRDPVEVVAVLARSGYDRFYLVKEEIALLRDPTSALQQERLDGSANLVCAISGYHAEKVKLLDRLSNKASNA